MTDTGMTGVIVIAVAYLAAACVAALDARRRGRGLAVLVAPFVGAIWWVSIRSRYPVKR